MVLGILVTAWLSCQLALGDSALRRPPIPSESGERWAFTAKKGYVFTDGENEFLVGGHSPVTILSIDSQGGEPALQFLGAMILGPRRFFGSTTKFDGWPPRRLDPDRLAPAVGSTLLPVSETWHQQGYELLLGYKIVEPSYAVRDHVLVTYLSDGTTYRADLNIVMVVCPPRKNVTRCLNRAHG